MEFDGHRILHDRTQNIHHCAGFSTLIHGYKTQYIVIIVILENCQGETFKMNDLFTIYYSTNLYVIKRAHVDLNVEREREIASRGPRRM